MAAGKYSFIIEQGATLNLQLDWKDANENPIDLTGYSARMHIRPTVESSTIICNLTSDNFSVCGTGLSLSGSNFTTPLSSGSIGVVISAASSSLFDFNEAYYDLEMVKGCDVYRLIEGKVKLSKNVTR